jgi:hypothetical protein
MYGILEGQFRKYFQEAERRKGITGTNLLMLLETRIDNVAYKLGFANSRSQARQMVRHGLFTSMDVVSMCLRFRRSRVMFLRCATAPRRTLLSTRLWKLSLVAACLHGSRSMLLPSRDP